MNSNDKTSVSVEIYGTKYKLLADSASSASYVTMVAAHVNEQMHAIAAQHPRLELSRLAVLAAINISDELLKTKEQLERANAVSIEKKNQELSELQAKYTEAMQELNLIKDGHSDMQAKLESAQADHEQLQAKLESTQAEHEQLQAKLESKQAEHEQLQAKLESTQAEHEQLQAKLESTLTDNEQLRAKLGTVELQLSERAAESESSIHQQYEKLKKEYAKLQTEFNEWIELTEEEMRN